MLLGEDGNRSRINRPNASLKDYVAIVAVVSLSVLGLLAVSSNMFTTGNKNPATLSFFAATEDSNAVLIDTASSSNSKPNIVFVLADDLGWNGIGYDNSELPERVALKSLTPTLNRLASEGVAMTNYYTQEMCTPSRATLLTGRYPVHTGMQFGIVSLFDTFALNSNETTFAQVLKSEGYDCHAIGKWHLGHHSPMYLPTSRGFDSFVGYLDGDNNYFSKTKPSYEEYVDFMEADSSCYGPCSDESAFNTYSTVYYRDRAISIINKYGQQQASSSSTPFFLYLSFQAVHNPFYDAALTDMDLSFWNETLKTVDAARVGSIIKNSIKHQSTQMYALSLAVLDNAIADIVTSLNTNHLDNTLVVFASDNGGCVLSGGRNAPLRGSKGSLFEGGTRVDAFMYSPSLLGSNKGVLYNNVFHVSDWFPTLLDFASISFTPEAGFELDGVSHYPAVTGSAPESPREFMLYNMYTHVLDSNLEYDFDVWTNGQFAIRNSQYKLMHTYNGSAMIDMIDDGYTFSDDDQLTTVDCTQLDVLSGTFSKYLFDLVDDPTESINLIDSSDSSVIAAKESLYHQVFLINKEASYNWYLYYRANNNNSAVAEKYWKESSESFIMPYLELDSEDSASPKFCSNS